jgi:hypothetical protein
VGSSEAQLEDRLASLVEADIIYRDDRPDSYCFKHALIRDALYASLETASRSSLHLQLAELLEAAVLTEDSNSCDYQERIARHFSAARNWQRSALWWQRAAERARSRFAMDDAIALCRLGLQDLAHCPDDHTRGELELALQVTLGPALMAVKGYADDEVADVYHRALKLCDQLQDLRQLVPALFGLWTFHCVRAQHPMAASLAQRLVDVAEARDDQDYRVEACLARGITRFFQDDVAGANGDLARVLDYFEPSMRASHMHLYGQDSQMVALSYQSWLAFEAGQPEHALLLSNTAIDAARRSKHPFTLCYGLAFAGWLHTGLGNHHHAQQLLEENLLLAERQGFHLFHALSRVFYEILSLQTGSTEDPRALADSLDRYAATGASLFMPHFLVAKGESLLQQGDSAGARACCREARNRIASSHERWSVKHVERLEAAIGPGGDNPR